MCVVSGAEPLDRQQSARGSQLVRPLFIALQLLLEQRRDVGVQIRVAQVESSQGTVTTEGACMRKTADMCPNDNASCTKPLLPKRWDSLFDSEAGSDVVFLVGPEQWRFPGHRAVLAAANPVFQAMLDGPMASHDAVIPIEDVDGRAFDNLLRFLYREEVSLQSVPTALNTLYAAFKYQCGGLVRTCVSYLDGELDASSVLEVYRHTRVYYDQQHAPSAPPGDDLAEALAHCGYLHHNCLQYIDVHADRVLSQEHVEDLDREALQAIAARETLALSSEMVLFDALDRWCNRECKKRRLELSAENRRSLLGMEVLHSVRYLLMSSEEFLAGPMQSGLLDQSETSAMLGHILGHPLPQDPPPHLARVLPRMGSRRPKPRSAPPCCLSPRSAPGRVDGAMASSSTPESSSGASKGSRRWATKWHNRKDKKQKKKTTGSPDREGKRNTGSCLVEYVFSALSCVFD